MEEQNDLHGSVPDNSPVALLVIDMMNTFEFPEGDRLLRATLPIARTISNLKNQCRRLGIPCLYVNDNFGKWKSNFQALIENCLQESCKGREITRTLLPDQDDYFVLKPKHSAFFATTLGLLLQNLGAKTLILTGIAGNICVYFSASDAYMRGYKLVVPTDCIASNSEHENAFALQQMKTVLSANITTSSELDLQPLSQA